MGHWNKWNVLSLTTTEDNGSGGTFTESAPSYTKYEYSEPTWHYSDKPGYNSHTGTGSNFTCDELPCNHWNEFRGHAIVDVRVYQQSGGQELSRSEHRFYQGMSNDWDEPGSWSYSASITLSDSTTRTDAEWLQGRTVETRALDGAGSALTRTVINYDHFQTASDGDRYARWVGTKLTETTTYGTPNRVTKTQISYDSYGNPTREYLDGSDTSAHSNIERAFHANTTDWIVALPKWEKLRAGHTTGGTLASHTKFYYDGSNNNGATPSVGNVTKVRAYDTATTYVDTVYTYDAGRVATVTDPESNTTTTAYDSTFGYPEKVTNAEGEYTENVADPGTGVPLSTKDPAGFTTEYEYDSYGRLTAVELPGDDTDDYLFEYSPGARPARVKTRHLVEEPSTWIDSYAYVDGFGRSVQTQTNHETSGQRIITATYFDPRGNSRRVSVPWQTSGNAGSGWVDPTWTGGSPSMPQQTVATYDRLGRITLSEVLRSNGNLLHDTETSFDGWDQTVTDPRGADTTYEYDAFGNLEKVTDDNNFATTYTYTTRLELDTVTRDGEVTDIDYDLLGRKKSLDDPDMGEWLYTYFDNSWLETQTDARNKVLTFAYDDAGRMTTKKYGTVTVAQWTYDTAGRLDQSKSWTDTGGLRVTINHDYETSGTDKRGRLLETEWITQGFGHGTDSYTIDYTYDNADRAYEIDLPTGETVETDYDNRSGMPIGLDGDDTYLDDATWNGQRRLTYGWSQEGTNAKLYRRWEWSSTTLRLWRIRGGTTSWGTQVADLRHWYNGPGDITKLRDQHNSGQYQCFTYDLLGRLTEAYTSSDATGCDNVYNNTGNGPYHYSYEYEDNSNIDYVVDETTTTTLQYTYGAGTAGPHAVTTMDGTTYTYDANGNQDGRGNDDLTWDASNRLIEYNPATGSDTEFIYDADGTRIVRLNPDGTSTTTIGGIYEMIQGGSDDIQRVTYRFNGLAIAIKTIEGTTVTLDWIIADHLGSSATSRDGATGATVRQWYAPFGAARASTGGSLPTDETYTGQVSDASTGLLFYDARYYDPDLRRFISADSIVPNAADNADYNRFAYVRNNPLRYTDPTGHCTTSNGTVIDGFDTTPCSSGSSSSSGSDGGFSGAGGTTWAPCPELFCGIVNFGVLFDPGHYEGLAEPSFYLAKFDGVNGAGVLVIDLFIQDAEANGSLGDDRGFQIDSYLRPDTTRVLIVADLEHGLAFARANPSCHVETGCSDAKPIAGEFGNIFQPMSENAFVAYSGSSGSVVVSFSMANSKETFAPPINGRFNFVPDANGPPKMRGSSDRFPSIQIIHVAQGQVTVMEQTSETASPVPWLLGPLPNRSHSYP